MPLLRHSLYSQNVNLYLAPTADGRDTWLPLMRTVACEGRCVVLSANQCMKKANIPSWITGKREGGRATRDAASDETTSNGRKESGRLRRSSTITSDGHEIALPSWLKGRQDEEALSESSSIPPQTRRKSTVTCDGNEIILPAPKDAKPLDLDRNLEGNEEVPKIGDSPKFASRGGSCIIGPMGEVLAGPLWDADDSLFSVDVDFEDCIRGRLDLDVGGSYSR
jgi:nitrilase